VIDEGGDQYDMRGYARYVTGIAIHKLASRIKVFKF
jgi:hypothetical protein